MAGNAVFANFTRCNSYTHINEITRFYNLIYEDCTSAQIHGYQVIKRTGLFLLNHIHSQKKNCHD